MKTFSFDGNKLYECKVLWNKIVKRIKILLLKSFNIICVCVKYMIEKWCGTLIIKGEKLFVKKKNHNYIINIQNFDPKSICNQ